MWAAALTLFFGRVLLPVRVKGDSMEPTVRNGSVRFAFLLRYAVSDPRPGDLVVIRMAGRKVMFLKRVLAVGGDRVAFERGALRVNADDIVLLPHFKRTGSGMAAPSLRGSEAP